VEGSEPGTSREPGLRFDGKPSIANDLRCKIGWPDPPRYAGWAVCAPAARCTAQQWQHSRIPAMHRCTTAVKAVEKSVQPRCSLLLANLIIVNPLLRSLNLRNSVRNPPSHLSLHPIWGRASHLALTMRCSLFDLHTFYPVLELSLTAFTRPDDRSSSHTPLVEINCSHLPTFLCSMWLASLGSGVCSPHSQLSPVAMKQLICMHLQ
jgi:hypothetical protein